jgi:hypothetical protein
VISPAVAGWFSPDIDECIIFVLQNNRNLETPHGVSGTDNIRLLQIPDDRQVKGAHLEARPKEMHHLPGGPEHPQFGSPQGRGIENRDSAVKRPRLGKAGVKANLVLNHLSLGQHFHFMLIRTEHLGHKLKLDGIRQAAIANNRSSLQKVRSLIE